MSLPLAISGIWKDKIREDPGLAGDCSARKLHRPHHHSHPDTGRPVCHVCHPPAETLK